MVKHKKRDPITGQYAPIDEGYPNVTRLSDRELDLVKRDRELIKKEREEEALEYPDEQEVTRPPRRLTKEILRLSRKPRRKLIKMLKDETGLSLDDIESKGYRTTRDGIADAIITSRKDKEEQGDQKNDK